MLREQDKHNKASRTMNFSNLSLSGTIKQLILAQRITEAKQLAKNARMSDLAYLTIEAQTFADMGMFKELMKYLKEKKQN